MTQHKIELVEKGKTLFSGDSVILNFDAEGPKGVTADNYAPPFTAITIRFNGILCAFYDVFNGPKEGPVKIENYESKKLGERYYEFTYRFTEADYQKATDCQ